MVIIICDSISDDNDKDICSSWLMHYLGSKNQDEFIATAIKLGYPILTKRMDHITAAAMWKESNISKQYQWIVLRYLLNIFSTKLVVPEWKEKCSFNQLIYRQHT